MKKWFSETNGAISEFRKMALSGVAMNDAKQTAALTILKIQLQAEYEKLHALWQAEGLMESDLTNLYAHINLGEKKNYIDIVQQDLPLLKNRVQDHVRETNLKFEDGSISFESLLHPIILQHAYPHFLSRHYREAVLNSMVAIFDLIRERSGLATDGHHLVSEAFSLDRARLLFSEIGSESGRNDQKGFMQILQGAYLGVRNPKAHSLIHDLDQRKAAQYLVFASLLARRVSEATPAQLSSLESNAE